MPKTIVKLPHAPKGEPESTQIKKNKSIKYVTFFGDSSIPEDSDLYAEVFEAAKLLAENGYGVVNGGGPGVMKAATDGAEAAAGDTIAVYWEPKLASIFEGKNLANETDESEAYSNYLMRTLGLIEKGQVYVVCKGGTGTMSEFAMVWALAKLYYGKHKPVILLGDFWPSLIEKIQESMIIDDNELGVLHYAKNRHEVLELVKSFELEVKSRARRTYQGDETPFILSPKFNEAYALNVQQADHRNRFKAFSKLTLRQLEEFKKHVRPPARVLEVGTGAGHDMRFLSQDYSLIAIENDPEMIELARFDNPTAEILNIDIKNYEVQENTFKGIWSRDTLHHLNNEDLHRVFAKLSRGLVPHGIMYIIVREGRGEGHEADIHGGKEITRYYNYLTEMELRELAEKNGLEVVKIKHEQRSHRWLAAMFRKL